MKRKKLIQRVALVFAIAFAVGAAWQTSVRAEFDTDWGVTWDGNGLIGYQDIANFLVAENYFSDFNEASLFAQSGYIGEDPGDADPYLFNNLLGQYQVEILAEYAGFKDQNVLGYYTGTGASKTLMQIFGGTDGAGSAPADIAPDSLFGLYLSTSQNNTWYTARAENVQQSGILKDLTGNPQALIYEMIPDREWLIAWEDLDASQLYASDNDYNDMYVRVTASVVPEPVSAVLYLLGSGVLTVVGLVRKMA